MPFLDVYRCRTGVFDAAGEKQGAGRTSNMWILSADFTSIKA